MDAKPLSIGKILSERQRFVVPIYQRTYAWTRRELEPLFEQVEVKASELLATGDVAFSHYMGALLLIPDGEPVFGRIQVFNVVDGQQRLTTFHLCFAALRDLARDYGFDDVAAQLSDLIIHGPQTPMSEPAVERYKLQPTAYEVMLREIAARKAKVQTLGNLTLLTPPANANSSNAAFAVKRDRLQDSLLKMNVTMAAELQWDEAAIEKQRRPGEAGDPSLALPDAGRGDRG